MESSAGRQFNSLTDRLEAQLRFIVEIDKLKHVYRQTYLMDASRRENSVEHSWHLALMVIVLAEHARTPDIDIAKVVKMVLVHDLVEIDAGDTFCYDEKGCRDQHAREIEAADRIFNLLPRGQAAELRALWDEFEDGRTAESRFARALDRLQPILHNYHTRGAAWRKHHIRRAQVLERNRCIEKGAPALWQVAKRFIDRAVDKGYLEP